jgi:hypothetical protein
LGRKLVSVELSHIHKDGLPVPDYEGNGQVIRGLINQAVNSGTFSVSITIPNDMVLRALIIRVVAPNAGDRLTIEHLDANDNVLFKFADAMFVTDNLIHVKINGKKLLQNQKIKFTYLNNGLSVTRAIVNAVTD